MRLRQSEILKGRWFTKVKCMFGLVNFLQASYAFKCVQLLFLYSCTPSNGHQYSFIIDIRAL